jgi:DNA-binding CsgD family transcriptional regulator
LSGDVFRPGASWAESKPVYLDAGPKVTEAYIQTPDRYRTELARWCALSRGRSAFVWEATYSRAERARMATQHEILDPSGLQGAMACPLWFGGGIVGLVMLFRGGRARPFSAEIVHDVTRLLPAFGLAEAALRRAAMLEPAAVGTADAQSVSALATLGARERQVASLIATGLSSKEIASALGSSFHTVRNQTRRIFERLGVRSRSQLAALLRG